MFFHQLSFASMLNIMLFRQATLSIIFCAKMMCHSWKSAIFLASAGFAVRVQVDDRLWREPGGSLAQFSQPARVHRPQGIRQHRYVAKRIITIWLCLRIS